MTLICADAMPFEDKSRAFLEEESCEYTLSKQPFQNIFLLN